MPDYTVLTQLIFTYQQSDLQVHFNWVTNGLIALSLTMPGLLCYLSAQCSSAHLGCVCSSWVFLLGEHDSSSSSHRRCCCELLHLCTFQYQLIVASLAVGYLYDRYGIAGLPK